MKAEDEEEEEAHSLSPLDYTVNNSNNNNAHNSSDHNTSLSPLNLVSEERSTLKGVKRVMAASHEEDGQLSSSAAAMDPAGKRMRNLVLLQDEHGQHIVHQLASPNGNGLVNSFNGFSHLATIRMSSANDLDFDSIAYLDDSASSPPMTSSMLMKPEEIGDGVGGGSSVTGSKSKSASPSPGGRMSNNNPSLAPYPTKTVAGTVIPSSKTCNWVFENGQVCGKTFSKSYNLVVHMRMHEDIRPFACTLCDQTFRQKAHLQRHETTHGIQSKNFYRNPSSRRKKRGDAAAASTPAAAGGRPSQIANANGLMQLASSIGESADSYPRRKLVGSGQNSDGEEFLEDEEDDLYVPNGSGGTTGEGTMKRPAGARKYSDTEARGEDREPDSDCISDNQISHSQRHKDWTGEEPAAEPMEDANGSHHEPQHHRPTMMSSGGDTEGEDRPDPLNLVARHGSDDEDDTSTVASILNTVNSVPTLEQKLVESSYQQLQQQHHHQQPQQHVGDNIGLLKQQQQRQSNNVVGYARVMETSANNLATLSLSTHNNNNSSSNHNNNNNTIPVSPLATTLAQHLPGATTTVAGSLAQNAGSMSILYTTLSGPTGNRLMLEGLAGEEHSPEIQAELLNALLADETYPEEIVEEEVYRLNTLPPTWWVSRRRKPVQNHPHHVAYDVIYYSPEGFGFRTRSEIQNFLQHDILSREAKLGGLRQPPIPLESIPIIDDDLPQTLAAAAAASGQQQHQQQHSTLVDANTIAAALIANLKPEPLENLQEVLIDSGKQLSGSGGATAAPLSTC
jgi:hypothetical protein